MSYLCQSHILRSKQEVDGAAFEPKVSTWSLLEEVRSSASSKVNISWGHREDKESTTPCQPQWQGLQREAVPALCGNPVMLQPTGRAADEEKPPTAPGEPPHSQAGLT